MSAGEQGYARLNLLALELLAPGVPDIMLLLHAACGTTVAGDPAAGGAIRQARQMQVLERGFQCMDHPVHPAIAETAYLKAFFCRLQA